MQVSREVEQQVDGAIDRLGSLVAGGPRAAQLLGILHDENVDFDRVTQLIAAEPSLAARLLRVANSAFYGQRGGVASVERAVALLGLQSVRAIAAAACLDQALPRYGVLRGQCDAILRHSVFCALAMQKIVQRQQPALAADAYTIGLLHDIGCAVLLVMQAPSTGVTGLQPLPAHEYATSRLLQRWQLPGRHVVIAATHHGVTHAGIMVEHRKWIAWLLEAEQFAARQGFSLEMDTPPPSSAEGPFAAGSSANSTSANSEAVSLSRAVEEELLQETSALLEALGVPISAPMAFNHGDQIEK